VNGGCEGPSALLISLGDGAVEPCEVWGWVLQPSGSVTFHLYLYHKYFEELVLLVLVLNVADYWLGCVC
jgi:hypothetical protein